MAANWLGTVFNFLAGAQYSSNPTPIADGSTGPLLVDKYGRLVMVAVGPGSAVSSGANTWRDAGAYANSGVVKASAGTLYLLFGPSGSASKRWLQIFDLAAVPANGVAPIFEVPVSPGAVANLDLPRGRSFVNGICWAGSTTSGTLTVATDTPFWINAEYF